MSERRVGFALSGGGHRATIWSIGAVLGFLRARQIARQRGDNLDIVSIASVSGGSIANGAIAKLHSQLNAVDSDAFVAAIAPLVRDIATVGVIPAKGRTRRFFLTCVGFVVAAVLATAFALGSALGAGRHWALVPTLVWSAATAMVAATILRRDRRVVIAGLLIGVAFGGGVFVVRDSGATWIVLIAAVAVMVWMIAIAQVSRRGRVVEQTLAEQFFNGANGPLRLSDLADREVHHVFCATELQTGRQMYLTPRVLSSWALGHSTDVSKVTLARAVQASAALPGGFPPQTTMLTSTGLSFKGGARNFHPDRLELVDGGVYDNLADQWEQGLADRKNRVGAAPIAQEAANFLVVANAGKSLAVEAFRGTGRVLGEIRGLLRDQWIQYDQTTSPRRRSLVREFLAATHDAEHNRAGVIVQTSTSPVDMASTQHDPDYAERERGEQWRAALTTTRTPEEWRSLSDRNAAVPSTLAALGANVVLDLLEQAIVLTQAALHVHYAIGDVDVIDRTELNDLFGLVELE